MNTCYIFGAGTRTTLPELPGAEDYVIAADGGYAWLTELAIPSDLLLGDFDSLGEIPAHPHTIRHAVEKDDTDMGLAVAEGWKRGYRRFVLYGGSGGRLDHTIANLQLLKKIASDGGEGYLYDGERTAFVLWETSAALTGTIGATVSVFAMDAAVSGVTLTGLQYPLNDAVLTNDYALGVSNAFDEKHASITVHKGALLVIGEFSPSEVRMKKNEIEKNGRRQI